jgi:hypothetical protein
MAAADAETEVSFLRDTRQDVVCMIESNATLMRTYVCGSYRAYVRN